MQFLCIKGLLWVDIVEFSRCPFETQRLHFQVNTSNSELLKPAAGDLPKPTPVADVTSLLPKRYAATTPEKMLQNARDLVGKCPRNTLVKVRCRYLS